jgi:hypothetical protein
MPSLEVGMLLGLEMHCPWPLRGSIRKSGSVCFANAINRLRRRETFVSLRLDSAMAKPMVMVPIKCWIFRGAFGVKSAWKTFASALTAGGAAQGGSPSYMKRVGGGTKHDSASSAMSISAVAPPLRRSISLCCNYEILGGELLLFNPPRPWFNLLWLPWWPRPEADAFTSRVALLYLALYRGESFIAVDFIGGLKLGML